MRASLTINLILFFLLSSNTLYSQYQLGLNINGESSVDLLGTSVSLSSDGSIIAVGAVGADGVNMMNEGNVRIYEWDKTEWKQKGENIDGIGKNNSFGRVSLSENGNRLAVGAIYNSGNGHHAGNVQVFDWNGIEWVQIGSNINGESEGDLSGFSVSLSSNGQRLAIGAPYNDGASYLAGHVRIFEWNGLDWVQLGLDIDGETMEDQAGFSVSLSYDGDRVAVGSPYNSGNGDKAGHVRVFELINSDWIQIGNNINGQQEIELFGSSISLSSNGSILAIGAPYNDENGKDAGQVRIYTFNGMNWELLGQSINGDSEGDGLGLLGVSLSSLGTKIAIGAPYNNGNGNDYDSGQVKIYEFIDNSWKQLYNDLFGEKPGDRFGWSVSLSSDGNTLAVGSPHSAVNGSRSGSVKVFSLAKVTMDPQSEYCINDGVQSLLTGGVPLGGIYSGPGIIDDGNGITFQFHPLGAGVGSHSIKYTLSGNSDSTIINVHPSPIISFTLPDVIDYNDGIPPMGLGGGFPAGGEYYDSNGMISDDGNGLSFSFNSFYVGVDTIYYRFIDQNSCIEIDSQIISIVNLSSTENQSSYELKIIPNITSGEIIILSNYDIESVQLINSLGGIAETLFLSNKEIVDLSHMPSGVYFIRIIYLNGMTAIGSVIKQ